MSVNSERMKNFFLEIVNIYSPSGKEVEALKFTEEHTSNMGIPSFRQYVDEKRYNLIIGQPLQEAKSLFIGHIDTVPAYDLEHYGAECKGDEIFGLGTADMKGGCAALIEAYGTYFEKHKTIPPASICLLVGEEENSDGAKSLSKQWQKKNVFIAEPTSLKQATGHYGYAELELIATGERRHAAVANRERNAIFTILKTLLETSDFIEINFPRFVLNIRDVHSSEAGFAVADRCRACIDLHIPPEAPFFENIENIINHIKMNISEPQNTLSVELLTADPGWQLSPEEEVIKLAKQACKHTAIKWQTTPFQSHSDASVFAKNGASPLLFGPGQIAKAHTRTESIQWQEIVKCAEFYLAIFEKL